MLVKRIEKCSQQSEHMKYTIADVEYCIACVISSSVLFRTPQMLP